MNPRFLKSILLSTLLYSFALAGLKAQTVTFTRTNITCHNAADGKMKIDITGGSSLYRYVCIKLSDLSKSDSSGATSALTYTFENRQADDYVFLVRDLNTGLIVELEDHSFPDPLPLNATIGGIHDINCFGSTTGSITISSATGGSGVFDYSINGGSNWQSAGTFNGLAAGTYRVWMRDRNNPTCVKILNDALQITQNPELSATVNVNNPLCSGQRGSITISNPTGGPPSGSYNYRINGGIWQTSASFNNLIAGTYTVEIRRGTCTGTLGTYTITQPPQLTANISINKGLTCFDGSDGRLQANVSGGTPPYTFEWQACTGNNCVSIGQTEQIATGLAQGRYRVIVTDANGCGTSPADYQFVRSALPSGIKDSIPPEFFYDGAQTTAACEGQTNGSITLNAHGGVSPYKYSITAGGASGYQTGNQFTGLAAGSYQPWVMDKRGCKKTGDNVIVGTTPNSPVSVTISADPSGSICPGTSVLFTASPNNEGTSPSYQWFRNGSPAGSNQPTYSYTPSNGDQVRVVLTSSIRCTSGNPATSNTITINHRPVTAIITHPTPVTQCEGTSVTFSVTATGENLKYQWRRNGTDIPGAKGSTYTINNIKLSDAGNYSVRVSSDCGPDVISNNASLTVNPATAITNEPVSLSQCPGSDATFTVTAVGTSLSYEWRKNGVAIPGTNSSSYTIYNITAADAGNYSVRVHGSCGADVISKNASLTLKPVTAITVQPVSITQCEGTNATFSVTAAGTGLSYQWRKDGTNIQDATSSTYTINNIKPVDNGRYSVVVTGECGPAVVSNEAQLIVDPLTAITVQPVNITQCEGTNATFTVTAVGKNLTYQWRKDGGNIGGANESFYTIYGIDESDEGSYSVEVRGACGSPVVSETRTLTVNPLTSITVQPVDITQCQGSTVTFTVTAQGTNLTYQWIKDGIELPGANSASLTIANIDASHTGTYNVRVSGDCGADVISNNAILSLHPVTDIVSGPVGAMVCPGDNYTFTVDANGINLSYQWKKDGENIPGATGDSYTIPSVSSADAGSYTVEVTGTCGTEVSQAAKLVVNIVPAVTAHPSDVTVCPGSEHVFTVTASGQGLTYLWRKNGIPMPAETGSTLTISNIDAADAGSYDVVITNDCGSVTSNAATLTVAENPAITDQPYSLDYCEGENITFSVTATGTAITYQWRKDGIDIPGAISPNLDLNAISLADAGEYDVVISGLCDSVVSDIATLTVYPATKGSIDEGDKIVCAGENVTFTVTGSGSGSLFYQWQKYISGVWTDIWDDSKYLGTFSPSLEIINVEIPDSGLYRVLVTADCGSVYTEPVRLDVSNMIATIGTPAPFLINTQTTKIEVGFKIEDHYLIHDLGFALVAPDGTEVMLKSPMFDVCGGNYSNPVNVDAVFTNMPEGLPVMDYCEQLFEVTGTFGSEGDWSVLNGKDPANGAWQIRVYDNTRYFADTDGILTSATLTFTDQDSVGNPKVISYNSGAISIDIVDPVAFEMHPTSYIAPMKLMTSCFNTEDAKAVVTVAGGVPPYSYEWSGPTTEANEAKVDLGPGIYTVTVTDFIGCTTQATVEVTSPAAIVWDDVVHTDTIICNGAAEGIIRAKASGGDGGFTYTLLPGDIPSSVADSGVFTGLTAGTYTLRVTDLNGCMLDTVITISERSRIELTITTVPVIGNEKGSIIVSATGGTPPYQYSIDNGTTLQDSGKFTGLDEGIYQVYVEDDTGCFVIQSVNLSVELLDVNVNVTQVSCGGRADGSFYFIINDGDGPYTLTGPFTDTLNVPDQQVISFTGQTAGTYPVKIEDSRGRIFMDTIEINEPLPIIVNASVTNPHCSYTSDGAIEIDASGGTGALSFAWDDGDTTEDRSQLSVGQYELTITDEEGCSDKYTYNLVNEVFVTVFAGKDTTICPGDTAFLKGSAGDIVRWEVLTTDGDAWFSDPDISNPKVTTARDVSLLYIVNRDGCAAQDTIDIAVDGIYGMSLYVNDGNLETDTAAYLIEGETVTLMFVDELGVFDTYEWSPAEYITYPHGSQHNVDVTPDASMYVTIEATTILGCREKASIHLVVARTLNIYNAFSPNGDGVNDRWVIEHAVEYGDKIHVKVFNRWGEPIFESKGYGGSNEWDGTRNGKMLPVGSYYYIINVNDGKTKPYTGSVTILR